MPTAMRPRRALPPRDLLARRSPAGSRGGCRRRRRSCRRRRPRRGARPPSAPRSPPRPPRAAAGRRSRRRSRRRRRRARRPDRTGRGVPDGRRCAGSPSTNARCRCLMGRHRGRSSRCQGQRRRPAPAGSAWMPSAASRPSRTPQTTSEAPRTMSPPANTPSMLRHHGLPVDPHACPSGSPSARARRTAPAGPRDRSPAP